MVVARTGNLAGCGVRRHSQRRSIAEGPNHRGAGERLPDHAGQAAAANSWGGM